MSEARSEPRSQVTPTQIREALEILQREREATASTSIDRRVYQWMGFLGFKAVPAWLLPLIVVGLLVVF